MDIDDELLKKEGQSLNKVSGGEQKTRLDENSNSLLEKIATKLQSGDVNPDALLAEIANSNEAELQSYLELITSYKEAGTPGEYIYNLSDGIHNIDVVGAVHTSDEKEVKKIEQRVNSTPTDILFVEVEPEKLEEIREAVKTGREPVMGESTYLAYEMIKNGVQVETWDIPYIDQLRAALEQYPVDAVVGVTIGQGLIHVIRNESSQNPVSRSEALRQAVFYGLGEETLNFIEKELNIPLTDENVRSIIKKYSGFDLDTMSVEDATAFMRPDGEGLVNKANEMTVRGRDESAIKKIYEAKQSYKNIKVIAGSAHAKVWERSLQKMFSKDG